MMSKIDRYIGAISLHRYFKIDSARSLICTKTSQKLTGIDQSHQCLLAMLARNYSYSLVSVCVCVSLPEISCYNDMSRQVVRCSPNTVIL